MMATEIERPEELRRFIRCIFLRGSSRIGFIKSMPICFTHPLHHGMKRLHTAPLSLCLRTPRLQGLSLGTYNIRDTRGFGLAQANWAVYIGNFNVMLLTKNKITSEMYYHNWLATTWCVL